MCRDCSHSLNRGTGRYRWAECSIGVGVHVGVHYRYLFSAQQTCTVK